MKIVFIADTHAKHRLLKLPPGDLLIHAGDVSYRGERYEVADFLDWFAKQPFRHKIFIAGNHDFFFERSKPRQIAAILPAGVIYLNDSGVEVEGLHIWGSPITPQFYQWAFNRKRGAAIQKHWDLIPAHTDILITHGPPYRVLDLTQQEQHVGCKELLQKVKEIRPRVHVFGHIHEGYGQSLLGGTRFINASVVNESYDLIHKPVVWTTPAGAEKPPGEAPASGKIKN